MLTASLAIFRFAFVLVRNAALLKLHGMSQKVWIEAWRLPFQLGFTSLQSSLIAQGSYTSLFYAGEEASNKWVRGASFCAATKTEHDRRI